MVEEEDEGKLGTSELVEVVGFVVWTWFSEASGVFGLEDTVAVVVGTVEG